jgi:hypothetical protein
MNTKTERDSAVNRHNIFNNACGQRESIKCELTERIMKGQGWRGAAGKRIASLGGDTMCAVATTTTPTSNHFYVSDRPQTNAVGLIRQPHKRCPRKLPSVGKNGTRLSRSVTHVRTAAPRAKSAHLAGPVTKFSGTFVQVARSGSPSKPRPLRPTRLFRTLLGRQRASDRSESGPDDPWARCPASGAAAPVPSPVRLCACVCCIPTWLCVAEGRCASSFAQKAVSDARTHAARVEPCPKVHNESGFASDMAQMRSIAA